MWQKEYYWSEHQRFKPNKDSSVFIVSIFNVFEVPQIINKN